jgi:hypothetical protein
VKHTAPSAQHQLDFLHQMQRILSDGSFVATYKFALLHALADLAVARGDDSAAELTLSTREIAAQMIELYWRQARPFPAPATPGPVELRQNAGRQAAILSALGQAQQEHGHSLARLRRSEAWPSLLGEVDRVLRVMPLWKLQTVGQERLSFLYENLDGGNQITLKPGVQYCLRTFYPLVVDLVRGAWLRFVRLQNAGVLGESGELGAFLFGTGRTALSAYLPILTEVQDGACLYCARAVGASPEIDHFVPWARYPVDLGHNLVLAHAACNRAKSDHLAAEPHLERWLMRNEANADALRSAFDAAGLVHDRVATLGVARWAYAQTARIGGLVWERGRDLRLLGAHALPHF